MLDHLVVAHLMPESKDSVFELVGADLGISEALCHGLDEGSEDGGEIELLRQRGAHLVEQRKLLRLAAVAPFALPELLLSQLALGYVAYGGEQHSPATVIDRANPHLNGERSAILAAVHLLVAEGEGARRAA